MHLARKRLIQLDGQVGPRSRRGPGALAVRPFTVEAMTATPYRAALPVALDAEVNGRVVRLHLRRCDVDVESLLASQLASQSPPGGTTGKAWAARRDRLARWLARPDSWRKLVDSWAVDWDHGRRRDPGSGEPVFDAGWQCFRSRKRRGPGGDPIPFVVEVEYAGTGRHRIAARVTDVLGNDGIAIVNVTTT